MPVYLAAIATFGFYLRAVPVKFALILRLSSHPGFGAGTSVFEGRFALRRAERRARGEKKRLPWRRAEADARKYRAAAITFRRLLRAARLEEVRASGYVGLPDAAQTALACGCVRALEAALRPVLAPGAVRLDVAPDFSGGGSDATLWCMFSISAGHIITSALIGAGEYLIGRFREWTGTPLKTS